MLAPMDCMELLMEFVRELPTVTMAITAAIPMMIPNIVSKALILFARRDASAKDIFSIKSIMRALFPFGLP